MKKIVLFYTFLSLWSFSCFGPDAELGDTLTGETIQVVGHGGSGFVSIDNYYPADSKVSILQALDILGADGVEVDIQMTSDSVLLLYHDNRLESQTNCRGCIGNQVFKVLESCSFRSNIAANFDPDMAIWKLEDLLANFAARPKPPWINLDISLPDDCLLNPMTAEYFRTLARQIIRLIRKYDAAEWVYIELSVLSQLEYLQRLDPGLNLVWLGEVDLERLKIAEEKNFWGVVTVNESINKELVEEAHQRGLGVILYNVKIRSGMLEAVAKGPDLIETDNIPLLHAILEKRK